MVTNVEQIHGPALAVIAQDIEVTRQQLGDAEKNNAGDPQALRLRLASLNWSAEILRRDAKGEA